MGYYSEVGGVEDEEVYKCILWYIEQRDKEEKVKRVAIIKGFQ